MISRSHCFVMMLFSTKTAAALVSHAKSFSGPIAVRLATMKPSSTSHHAFSTSAVSEETLLESALYRIRKVNHMPANIKASLLDFIVDDVTVGKVRPKIADLLCSTDEDNPVFCIKPGNNDNTQSYLTLTPEVGTSVEERTVAVNRIMQRLRDQGIVTGWRDEDYPVKKSFYDETLFGVERASASLLGIMEYGVHINGLVQGEDGKPRMWIGRRAADKSKYPGMLDHIVAGGQPVGLSLLENVVKECNEEAGIPDEITLAGLSSAGAISYETYSERNDHVTRCVLFNFDLHLPSNFVPQPVDGEVQEFFLWDVDQIKASLAPDYHDPIKPNCYPVIIDYMMRCGHFSSDSRGYLDILKELRGGDCY